MSKNHIVVLIRTLLLTPFIQFQQHLSLLLMNLFIFIFMIHTGDYLKMIWFWIQTNHVILYFCKYVSKCAVMGNTEIVVVHFAHYVHYLTVEREVIIGET